MKTPACEASVQGNQLSPEEWRLFPIICEASLEENQPPIEEERLPPKKRAASLQADQTSRGEVAQPPPKKCNLDKGKEVIHEPPVIFDLVSDSDESEVPPSTFAVAKKSENNGLLDKGKACLHQETQEANPKPNNNLGKDKSEQESGTEVDSSLRPAYSVRSLSCKFCDQRFPSRQALGGHQNAHRAEKAKLKSMSEANEGGTSLLPYTMSGAHLLPYTMSGAHLLPTPYFGQQSQYPSYNGDTQRSWQRRPDYSPLSTGSHWCPYGLGQPQGGFIGPSSTNPVGAAFNPGWPTPYAPPTGSAERYKRPSNFNPPIGPYMADYLEATENEARLKNRQRVVSSTHDSARMEMNLHPVSNRQYIGSSSLNLSPDYTESARMMMNLQPGDDSANHDSNARMESNLQADDSTSKEKGADNPDLDLKL